MSAAIAIAVIGVSAIAVVEPESYSATGSRPAVAPAPVVTAVLTTSSLDGHRLAEVVRTDST